MNETYRQGMVKAVRVREYNGEARFLEVMIKVPTDLPAAEWQSANNASKGRNTDEFMVSMPLDAVIRPGDMVALNIGIAAPTEVNRFRPALEVGVEQGMVAEAKEDKS